MKPIPAPMTVITGEQGNAQSTIDDFFSETVDFVMKEYDAREMDFNIRSGELAYSPPQITDDRVTYLLYRESVVAAVFETRTESNWLHYTFFRDLHWLDKHA